tara:strand:+ start:2853 stop:3836 length:984 start_codon:yes stop_codon:yes gene_type:complete
MKNLAVFILGIAFTLSIPSICFAQANSDSTSLRFNLSIDSGYLVLNDDFSNCIEIQDGDVINVTDGYTKVRFMAKYFYDSIVGVQLAKGEQKYLQLNSRLLNSQSKDANKSSFARCYWDSNVFILSETESMLTVNGEELGTHHIRLKLEEGFYRTTADYKNNIAGTAFRVEDGITVVRNYVRPTRGDVYKKILVPGYAQIAKRQYLKSSLFITGITAFGASALIFDNKITTGNKEYDLLRIRYNEATNPNEVLDIIAKSVTKMDQIKSYENIRKISLIGLVTVYGLNIIDGFIPPKSGFRSTKFEFNPYVDFDKSLVPTATLKVSLK